MGESQVCIRGSSLECHVGGCSYMIIIRYPSPTNIFDKRSDNEVERKYMDVIKHHECI